MAKLESHAADWRRPPRPRTLSDPEHDFLAEELQQLLATRDSDLGWRQLRGLFGPLPAGTFDEVAYFLPLAFAHMQRRADGFPEYLTGFVYWLSHNVEGLDRLGATKRVHAELRRTFAAWTAAFHVLHFDKAACRSMGWTLEYDDSVDSSGCVAALIHTLVDERVFASVAEEFVANLAKLRSAKDGAWFLEVARWQETGLSSRVTGDSRETETEETIQSLLRASREQGIGFSEEDADMMRRSSRDAAAVTSVAIRDLVRDASLRQRALDRVRASDLFDPEATYWRDLLRILELEP
ncbi:MAG: hypothetical protein AB7T63_16285 [Planctomycetota bacterium]